MGKDAGIPFAPRSLGTRIAHARRLLGVREGTDVTVPILAERVGVTGASVYNWEADLAVPSEANLEKLAAVLGTSPAALRYGISDVVMVGGLPIDRSTIHTFTPEEIAQFKRELAEEEAKKAVKPPPKKRNNG